MARKKSEDLADDSAFAEVIQDRFVLAKSHGVVVAGKACKFYPAGTEFDPEEDSGLISILCKSGAQFE